MQFRYATEAELDREPTEVDELTKIIEAVDTEEAAEKAAEKSDTEGGESVTEQCVWVLDPDTKQITEYLVFMELVPQYRATRL
jgi:ketosteroid isomerase-like protein